MNRRDQQILGELLVNSRQALSVLAKKLRMNRETLAYTIDKFEREGVIQGFITHIDYRKLGYVSASIFTNLRANGEKTFVSYLENRDDVSWSGLFTGKWRLGFELFAKTYEDLDVKVQNIYNTNSNLILDFKPMPHKNTEFFLPRYF